MKFNINYYVYVKLTDYGRKVHREDFDKAQEEYPPLAMFEYEPPKEDEEGWSKWQLWFLMQTFGKHMGNGCKNLFETRIRIPDEKQS